MPNVPTPDDDILGPGTNIFGLGGNDEITGAPGDQTLGGDYNGLTVAGDIIDGDDEITAAAGYTINFLFGDTRNATSTDGDVRGKPVF